MSSCELAVRTDLRRAAGEEHLGLEHEAVADDLDIVAVAEDLAQLAEEVRAVARQFLHALGERHIQPLAEIGDAGLRFPVALFRGVERVFERGDLAAKRGDLLVEQLDLRHRLGGKLLLLLGLGGQRGDAGIGGFAFLAFRRRAAPATGCAPFRRCVSETCMLTS